MLYINKMLPKLLHFLYIILFCSTVIIPITVKTLWVLDFTILSL